MKYVIAVCIAFLATLFIFKAPFASTKTISGKKHNALVDKYNRGYSNYVKAVKQYNALVTKTNNIIDMYNVLAYETGRHVKDYYAVRQQVYDTFSLGRMKVRQAHPSMAVPKPCDEKSMEKYTSAEEKADVRRTKQSRIEGMEIIQQAKDVALLRFGMNRKLAELRARHDQWNYELAMAKKAWAEALVTYGSFGVKWVLLKNQQNDINAYRAVCRYIVCYFDDLKLEYGTK